MTSVLDQGGQSSGVVDHFIWLHTPLPWVCATVGEYHGYNCVGRPQTFSQTPCKQNIGYMVADIEYGFTMCFTEYLTQAFKPAIGGRFLVVVGQVLVTDDLAESGTDAVFL